MFPMILIPLGILLLGCILSYSAVSSRIKAGKVKEWPVVKGTILSSEVLEDVSLTPTMKTTYVYYPAVTYEFIVNGQKYNGKRITYGSPRFVYLDAASIRDRFLVGSQVDVYYDPNDPNKCLLAPKSKVGLRSLIPGIFFIAVGIIIILVMFIFPT